MNENNKKISETIETLERVLWLQKNTAIIQNNQITWNELGEFLRMLQEEISELIRQSLRTYQRTKQQQ